MWAGTCTGLCGHRRVLCKLWALLGSGVHGTALAEGGTRAVRVGSQHTHLFQGVCGDSEM